VYQKTTTIEYAVRDMYKVLAATSSLLDSEICYFVDVLLRVYNFIELDKQRGSGTYPRTQYEIIKSVVIEIYTKLQKHETEIVQHLQNIIDREQQQTKTGGNATTSKKNKRK